MNEKIRKKLEAINSDFSRTTGKKVTNFFCPLLHVDDDTELCKAHIINKSFSATARAWTVQRKDIDSFYGSFFEGDFASIEYIYSHLSPDQVFLNKDLSNKYKPSILHRDEEIGYFYPKGQIPDGMTRLQVTDCSKTVEVCLKIDPKSILESEIEMEVNKDIRVHSVVSLIKAAYLTLFEMLGYKYALSDSGGLVGYNILGHFYRENYKVKTRTVVIDKAQDFFENYVHMVRPIEKFPPGLKGTASDKNVYICQTGDVFWGCIVFVKISAGMHAVLLPIFETATGKEEFYNFLSNPPDCLKTRLGVYKDGTWQISPSVFETCWPKIATLRN